MGKRVYLNRIKIEKSGPIELIVGGVLQPGYDKYINKPTVSASGSANLDGVTITKGTTWASVNFNSGGDDYGGEVVGSASTSVKINFLPRCLGKTYMVTYRLYIHGRFWNSGNGNARDNQGIIYRKYGSNDDSVDVTKTNTLKVDGSDWYFQVSGSYDGWSSKWAPHCEVRINYLAIL